MEQQQQPAEDDLSVILTTQEGFENFWHFLEKEVAVENLMFWREVEDFRAYAEKVVQSARDRDDAESSAQILIRRGRPIFEEYLTPGSRYEVNCPQWQVAPLRLLFEFRKPGTHRKQGLEDALRRNVGKIRGDGESDSMSIREADKDSLRSMESIASGTTPAKASPFMFDACQAEVYKMMNTDLRPRFLKSQYGAAWKKARNEKGTWEQ
ncbi:regulator of G protein signaling superfamily [Gonapodya prolifera JEL478]|uniref:Regulator of G protein signaling superfamily n=1 Tax=Gonapodya prolifera (strain JEL478) TaxID=1344416 RepID=A0A139A8V3_GONPJ|nr:regulator of G protein signaling superfamily [Gonapodya prolifera JEL478]|eukprot:KXS13118.1 regulator of G protein signaling superfamily [Gonapodya prolifera JEL478]